MQTTHFGSIAENEDALELLRVLFDLLPLQPDFLTSFQEVGTCPICDSEQVQVRTRSSWLNCALRDDEAVYWVSIGHYEAVAVGN